MDDESLPRAKRFRVERMRIIYDTGESFWTAPVIDLSETGIFVETAHDLPRGTQVTILPDAAGDEALPFEILAEVVRVNEYDPDESFDRTPGLAFRWRSMSVEQIKQVHQFLLQHGVEARDA